MNMWVWISIGCGLTGIMLAALIVIIEEETDGLYRKPKKTKGRDKQG